MKKWRKVDICDVTTYVTPTVGSLRLRTHSASKGISNSLYVSLLVKYDMSSTNTLTNNNSNGQYLVCPVGREIINKVLSHSTLELVQGVLVHVHTTLLSSLIYCMTHHQKSYVAKSTNNYLTTIGDALTYIGSNITHIQVKQMMWQAINEEMEESGNIASQSMVNSIANNRLCKVATSSIANLVANMYSNKLLHP